MCEGRAEKVKVKRVNEQRVENNRIIQQCMYTCCGEENLQKKMESKTKIVFLLHCTITLRFSNPAFQPQRI